MSETLRVFSLRRDGHDAGPTHAVWAHAQAWCGVRAQFRHWTRPGSVEAVTCAKCQRAIRRGRPYARG